MKSKAFTLIELLVVIAIIGILATVVLSSLGSARERARDARRHSDIKAIQQALEVYYLENGHYPTTYGTADGINAGSPNGAWANSSDASWIALENKMGVDLPEDPVNETTGWPGGGKLNYAFTSKEDTWHGCPGGQSYMLVYTLEGGVGPSERQGVRTCDGNILNYSPAITVGVSPAGA